MSDRPRKRRLFCGLEMLETRQLMAASPLSAHITNFVYTETDNSNPGQNAVIAYKQQSNGDLEPIGSFNTGGTGVANPQGLLGPDDTDKEVIASPNGKLLFAVNQASNSIAVFRVRSSGSLELVDNTPVSSGGTEPVSLAIDAGRLYVVNRGDELQGLGGAIAPTITVFKMRPTGVLKEDFAATTTLPVGLSPSQLLISSTSGLAFLDTFTPPPLDVTDANEVLPYQISADGALIPVASGGVGAPVTPPLILGLVQNPTQNLIYGGLTGANQEGVFAFDAAGDLSLVGTVPVQGHGPCWGIVSANGQFLYTSDTATNSVGVFSLADPRDPVQIQEFVLGGPQNATGNPGASGEVADFEFALSPDGSKLYVIDHQTDAAGDFPQGNALHVLSVASNGTLTEGANSPVFLPANIPAGADPQGVAVIAKSGFGRTR